MRKETHEPGMRGLEALLEPLDREQLRAILVELADRQPGLVEWIAALAAECDLGAPAGTPPATALPPPDPVRVEQELLAALRPQRGRGRRYDYEYFLTEVVGVLQATANRSRPYLDAGDAAGALVYLDAAAELATARIEELLGDEGQEIETLCHSLGRLLAEAFLAAELSPAERRQWSQKVSVWVSRSADYGYDEAFAVARRAAERGWDDPGLRQLLGAGLPNGAAPGEGDAEEWSASSAKALAEVGLGVLERQDRWEDYLRLAAAAGLAERYFSALIRLGRLSEAVEYGVTRLTDPVQAVALSRALDAAGAAEAALQVAQHALENLDAGPYPSGVLPRWTRDLSARLGRREDALQAAVRAMQEQASLEDYLAVQSLAGGRWPGLREELLKEVRRTRSYYPSAQVDIFLHEGLMEDAMAVVDASPGHELVGRVAEAALPTHPDWVFRACAHQFDRIADAGKSTYYAEAAQWLAKAGNALKAAGREAEWRTYLEGIITRHHRKYGLRPLLEHLR